MQQLKAFLSERGASCTSEVFRLFESFPAFAGNPVLQDQLWQKLAGGEIPRQDYTASNALYNYVFATRDRVKQGPPIVWTPTEKVVQRANLQSLFSLSKTTSVADFYQWSISEPELFWKSYIDPRIRFATKPDKILDLPPGTEGAEHARWLPGSLYNIAESCFTGDLNRPAIVFATETDSTVRTWSLGYLFDLVRRIAVGLPQCGFKKGDRVAIMMPMNPESVAIYLGIIAAGGAVVSIADSFSSAEISTRLRISQSKLLFCVDRFSRGGKPVDLMYRAIEAGVERLVIVDGDMPYPSSERRTQDISFEALLDRKRPVTDFGFVMSDSYNLTNIIFSSGTTGDPKAVPWTQLSPIKTACDGFLHQDVHPGDVLLWPTNLGWMMGPHLIYSALLNGGTIALYVGQPAGRAMGNFVSKAKVSLCGVIPAMVKNWLRTHCMDECDWRNIRVFSSTGERSDEDYFYLMWLAHFKAPIIEFCGGTELAGGYFAGTVLQPAALNVFNAPSFGTQYVVLKMDEDETNPPECKEGEEGEVFLVPPMLGCSQGLLNADHHKVYYAGCPRLPDGRILRRHGDRMRLLPGGFFESQGRADDTMNLGGIKTSCADLERAANGHPDVVESAAVAVHAPGGSADMLVIYVVLKNAKTNVSKLKSELQSLISDTLNPLFRIFDVKVVEQMPKTATNKTMRRTLRASYVFPQGRAH